MKKSPPASSVSRLPSSVPRSSDSSVFRLPSSVLIAVTGMSPAILTETVWALAHERPPVRPCKVVAFCTARSREQVRRDLLESGVWESLRQSLKARPDELEFGDTGDHIRVFTRGVRELEDIRTPDDSAAAADFILGHLRQFTENPDLRVVASIAGGRKTMSALLYACMTLIGRETDRVTHVLVGEPFEEIARPARFFYPAQKEQKLLVPDGRAVLARNARIELADIPFVPLRNRFTDLGRMPGNFSTLVRQYAKELRHDAAQPAVVALTAKGVRVNDREIVLGQRPRWTLEFLLQLNRSGAPVPRQSDAGEPFAAFLAAHADPGARAWSKSVALIDDLKRELNHLRTAFRREGIVWMPGLRADSLRLPPFERVE